MWKSLQTKFEISCAATASSSGLSGFTITAGFAQKAIGIKRGQSFIGQTDREVIAALQKRSAKFAPGGSFHVRYHQRAVGRPTTNWAGFPLIDESRPIAAETPVIGFCTNHGEWMRAAANVSPSQRQFCFSPKSKPNGALRHARRHPRDAKN